MHRLKSEFRRLSRRLADDAGSAAIEFLGAGVLLLVPIAYGGVTLAHVEQAMLATELGARNAARVLVSTAPAREALAEAHIAYALQDAGFAPESAHVAIACSPNPNPNCDTAGGHLTVSVRVDVPLPLIPGASNWLSVPVESDASFPRSGTEANR